MKEAAMKATETETQGLDTTRQVDWGDVGPRDEVELVGLVDDPGFEEESDGYGHGV